MSASGYLHNLPTLGKILSSKGKSFIHNPELLNKQSLLMASLVLVLNRTAIANYSALKAKDSPDGPYRTHEAYRTTIREFLGFTGGFLVLRQLQSLIKNGFKHGLNIQDDPNPNTYPMWENIKKWWHNPASTDIKPFEPKHWVNLTPQVDLKNPHAQRLIRWAEKLPGVNFADKAAKETYIRQVYKLGPIVLASIPTVALAGVLLEKFTRDHADHVADYIGRLFGGASHGTNPKAQKSNAPAAPGSFSAVSAAPPISSQVPSAVQTHIGANSGLAFGHTNMPAMAATPWATPQRSPQPWAGSPLG